MHTAPRTVRALHAITSANPQLLKSLHDELDKDESSDCRGAWTCSRRPSRWRMPRKEAVIAKHEAGGARRRSCSIPRPPSRSCPSLSPQLLGATYSARPGAPLAVRASSQGMADAATREGAEIRTGTRVDRLARSGDRVIGVLVPMVRPSTPGMWCWLPTPGHLSSLPDLPDGALVPSAGPDPGHPAAATAPGPVCPFGTNFGKEYGRQTPASRVVCGGYHRLALSEGFGNLPRRVCVCVRVSRDRAAV